MQMLVFLSTYEDRAKAVETKVQELSFQNSKSNTFEIQCSLDDAKAKEKTTLNKENAKIKKAKKLEKEVSIAKEQIKSMLDLGYEEYLKRLKDCHMFFVCYNLDANIKVVDKHLKELGVRFD